MRFLADDMLGRLATWLRIFGLDTYYSAHLSDTELVRIALQDERIVLTRDTHLSQRYRLPAVLLIKSDDYLDQLKEVLSYFQVKSLKSRMFTRCLVCNCPIQDVPAETVLKQVPPYVARTQSVFLQCPKCLRIYWKGTHYTNTVEKIKDLSSG